MALPATAAASSLPTAPTALFGIDIADLVQSIIAKLVSIVLPGDLAGRWAVELVRWLVAVPDVTDAARYPHLNAFRSGLVGVGFALLAVSVTICGLQVAFGAPILAQAAKRTVVACGVLVIYPKLISTAILGLNIATGQMVANKLIAEGTDKMLGAALVLSVATGGFGWSIAVGAAMFCLYFMAALMAIKIGLTAITAVLVLAGALVWGLYPLPATSWLARAWTAGAVTIALVPVAWALIFSAGALLTSDSLVWSSTGTTSGSQLQQIVKPFAALACFWVAYRAPVFLMAAGRAMGIHPSALVGRSGGGAGASRANPLTNAVQTNRDRFRAIGHRVAGRGRPLAGNVANRATSVKSAAIQSARQHLRPQTAIAPASPSGQMADPGLGVAISKLGGKAARGAKTAAGVPLRANRSWKQLAAEGAALRRKAHSPATAPTVADGRRETAAHRRPAPSPPSHRTPDGQATASATSATSDTHPPPTTTTAPAQSASPSSNADRVPRSDSTVPDATRRPAPASVSDSTQATTSAANSPVPRPAPAAASTDAKPVPGAGPSSAPPTAVPERSAPAAPDPSTPSPSPPQRRPS